MSATLRDQLYIVDEHVQHEHLPMTSRAVEKALLWHRCISHKRFKSLGTMYSMNLLHGCKAEPGALLQAGDISCEPCIRAKTQRAPHTQASVKTTILLHQIHMDVKGTFPMGVGGYCYMVTVTDEARDLRAVGNIVRKSVSDLYRTQSCSRKIRPQSSTLFALFNRR